MTRALSNGPHRGQWVRDDEGSAMAEFAVALPLLAVLAFATVDFGRAIYYYNAVSSIARDGARFGAAQTIPIADSIRSRVAKVTPSYLPAGDQVVVDSVAIGGGVRVKVSYVYHPWMPLVFKMAGQDTTLAIKTSATFRREWP